MNDYVIVERRRRRQASRCLVNSNHFDVGDELPTIRRISLYNCVASSRLTVSPSFIGPCR